MTILPFMIIGIASLSVGIIGTLFAISLVPYAKSSERIKEWAQREPHS